MKLNKKGSILAAITEGGTAFVMIGMFILFIGLVLVMGANLQTTQLDSRGSQACAARSDSFTSYNATAAQCYNSTGSHTQVGTHAWNVTVEGLQATLDIGEEQTTFSSVGIIGVIIGILLAVFGGFLVSKRN